MSESTRGASPAATPSVVAGVTPRAAEPGGTARSASGGRHPLVRAFNSMLRSPTGLIGMVIRRRSA